MKFLSNLHTHTIYSDGKDEPEEYIKKAIEKNFISLGFSDHALLELEENISDNDRYTMKRKNIINYRNEILNLKEKYYDEIEIYLGVEEDYLPKVDKSLYDYTIGAVHNFIDLETKEILSVDHTPEKFEKLIEYFDGVENLVEAYYNKVKVQMIENRPDIVAHIDLITKFNKDNRFFNIKDIWYKNITRKTIEELSKYNFIFEINTGAISRKHTDKPYPSEDILYEIKKHNLPITISSDCHSAENIDFYFTESIDYVKDIGFKKLKLLKNNVFQDINI